jgi:hypothetical protein
MLAAHAKGQTLTVRVFLWFFEFNDVAHSFHLQSLHFGSSFLSRWYWQCLLSGSGILTISGILDGLPKSLPISLQPD